MVPIGLNTGCSSLINKIYLILIIMFICNTIGKCSISIDTNRILDKLLGDKNTTNNSLINTPPSLLQFLIFIFSYFMF